MCDIKMWPLSLWSRKLFSCFQIKLFCIILFNKNSFCLFNTVVHFDTWYINKTLIYWALGKAACFVIPQPAIFPTAAIAVSGSQNMLFHLHPVNKCYRWYMLRGKCDISTDLWRRLDSATCFVKQKTLGICIYRTNKFLITGIRQKLSYSKYKYYHGKCNV